MKIKDEFKIYLKSLQRTRKIAAILAKNIKKGLCICLHGDLGTGKTTFSRFFINSLSKKNINVPSPTFSMVQLYELKNFSIWHYDLYRLSNKTEIFALDFDLALNDIVLIEWPEIIKDFLPSERIDIFFKEDKNRKLYIKLKLMGNLKINNNSLRELDES